MLPLKKSNKFIQFVRPDWVPGYPSPFMWVTLERRSAGFVQPKPYNVPSSYWIDDMRLLSGRTNCNSWHWSPTNPSDPNFVRAYDSMVNRARSKFVNKLGDTSSFGATMTAERKETFGMVVNTILRAATAARQVRRMQFGAAAKTLGLPYRERTVTTVRYTRGGDSSGASRRDGPVRKRRIVSRQRVMSFGGQREVVKTAASGWLMWSYGVKPLAQDIYNGMDVLQRPFPWERIASGAACREQSRWEYTTYMYRGKVRISADIRVENPNLWLANQLGLVNPVQWLNEAIPFSFVVDWFSNLSQVISQFTDFVGLEVSNPCFNQKLECTETRNQPAPYEFNYSKRWTRFSRDLLIPSAKLTFAYERFNWQRGLNAISLLIGFLPKGKA